MRKIITILLSVIILVCCQPSFARDFQHLRSFIPREEKRINARIGVAVIDTENGTVFGYRGTERFPLNSTYKAFACAALLHQLQRSGRSLDDDIRVMKGDLVEYSPITQNNLSPETMTLRELCSAAVSYSDNTAANKVVDSIGGPAGVTRFMRSLGDNITRLDRMEPSLNEALPGDARDTTTPDAVTAALRKIFESDILLPDNRSPLRQWMINDKVADGLLRASLPSGWKIADKTGAGGYGSRSIVAAVYPVNKKPLYVAIYITQTKASLAESDKVIAEMGKLIFE